MAVRESKRNIRTFLFDPFRFGYLYSSLLRKCMGWIVIVVTIAMFKNMLNRSQKSLQNRVVCEMSPLMLRVLDQRFFGV